MRRVLLIGICGWLWDCVLYLPEGNTLADNGSAISGGFGDSQSDMIIACYPAYFIRSFTNLLISSALSTIIKCPPSFTSIALPLSGISLSFVP